MGGGENGRFKKSKIQFRESMNIFHTLDCYCDDPIKIVDRRPVDFFIWLKLGKIRTSTIDSLTLGDFIRMDIQDKGSI